MTGDDRAWEQENNAFLRAALDWLRARVARLVPEPGTPDRYPASPPAGPPPDRPLRRGRRPGPLGTTELPEPSAAGGDAEAAARRMDEAASGTRPPAMLDLARGLGLSRFERDVLLLAVAPEFDTSFSRLYADAQGDPARRHATFALAMAAFEDPTWEALAPGRPLRLFELLTVGPAESLVTAPLRVGERVVNFVKGLDHLDRQLATLRTPLDIDPVHGSTPSQQAAVQEILRVASAPAGGVVNLVGADRPSKQLVAADAADRLGMELVRLPVAHLPSRADELATLGRLLERERRMSRIALYVDAVDAGAEHAIDPGPVDRLLGSCGGLVLLDSREPWPWLPHRGTLVEVGRPTTAEQTAVWSELLADDAVAAATAAEFDLDLDAIHAAAESLGDAPPELHTAVREACRRRCRPRLGLLAERLAPRTDDDALVLAPDLEEQLRLVEQQVQYRSRVLDDWGLAGQSARGLGLTVLFAGEPGVGKTFAAEVLAGRLDLDLYRIDLSGVVSKYIGETEKNLRQVFDAADRGGAILFFDEADALFGKRSEVRDSHDRYANIEVSYLLARMEVHRGLAILATNRKGGLDQAFARRMRICIDFRFPAEQERAGIWARAFPPGVRTDRLDRARLARLSLAGGAIRNVAVNATFMAAASAAQVVTMPMVLMAARREYRKLGLPASAADFHVPEPVGGTS